MLESCHHIGGAKPSPVAGVVTAGGADDAQHHRGGALALYSLHLDLKLAHDGMPSTVGGRPTSCRRALLNERAMLALAHERQA